MPIIRSLSAITPLPSLYRRVASLAALVMLAWLALPTSCYVQAEEPEATLVSFSREERQDALRQIPFNNLRPHDQNRVTDVVKDPSIFRRLPVQVIDCDPELYAFLVSYPEVVVSIWELMGITTVQVQRIGPAKFHANDGAGTVSNVDIIYADNDTNVFFAEGYYEGPLAPKKITAQCVLVLKSGFTKAANGKAYISNRLDVFVKFESRGADFLARTLHPLIGKTADYNFAETSSFIGKISKNAESNVAGMQNLIAKLNKVEPTVREQFGDVVGRVYQRKVIAERNLQQQMSQEDTSEPVPLASAPAREPAVLEQFAPGDAKPLAVNRIKPTSEEGTPVAAYAPVPRKRHAELRR
ncbi:hypothetical protein DTL21_25310 [Bremerella cremea]|uniref:Uncharacterized protein n=1 Tax=Blastopirellula marina TaxID=124 RepID=A0A2S8FB61_9BACT|nr:MULTISPECIES: hypothetical protein [Pirellulaceae]PQO29387.1 hypothetical protein C5Y83_25265 [Blastopirellula marina]RCS42691.1 hypothetical protein DTL21_25310 [Bremerella cremea]